MDVRTCTNGGVQYLSVAAPVRHGAVQQGAVRLTVPTRTVHERVHHVWLLLALGGLVALTAPSSASPSPAGPAVPSANWSAPHMS
ncbi:hypothetical protein OG585_14650 [Streptomyces sp. NBC_01340]|uniref:hypothetical protein n=1 Tax=unclassified Streptomyces TaxID=2593676 RepID=UPI00225B1AA0|nr:MULTISPECIES: hypothetical protein [unclassified Streptomyces]MCX4453922.1 hypothetical protein [Streptomyces sp. NBC_01719]MCX4493282.1 hypothetical protein [Streptomyces sp. NBC_01728]MCX4592165.1 hypothetical protein [Streptomyces sp. NBC_01549]WSI38418.1 hypothetical protein OG585_14650 [Streptomyces sp. NBC_01340]